MLGLLFYFDIVYVQCDPAGCLVELSLQLIIGKSLVIEVKNECIRRTSTDLHSFSHDWSANHQ
jgi:hypothetical protein